MTDKEKDELLKKGAVGGGIMASMGAGVYGGGKLAEKAMKDPVKAKRILGQYSKEGVEQTIKHAKKAGPIVAVTGTAIGSVAAYKHYKNKKKKDDSTEK